MGDKTGIEWTDATWNPVTGCSKVSAGCKNCYAKYQAWPRLANARGTVYFGRHFEDVKYHVDRLDDPLRWTKPRRIFVNSMSDLFHEKVPFDFIDKVFAVMALAPRHTFQILTKRPERMREYMARDETRANAIGHAWMMLGRMPRYRHEDVLHRVWPLPNVWLGVSVEDQANADLRIPMLLRTIAAIRWISAEPLLGPVDLKMMEYETCAERDGKGLVLGTRERMLDWVVVGGESGAGARPMHVAWARDIVAQCRQADIPVLVKQLGADPRGWCASNVPENIGDDEHRQLMRDDPELCDNYEAHEQAGHCNSYGKRCVMMTDRKGGDMTEWPADLRVREYPR
jgi:protein gp37